MQILCYQMYYKMKKIINEILVEALKSRLLDEGKLGINDLPKTTGLYISKNPSSTNAIDINLYDPKQDKCYGGMQININDSSKYFYVVSVAAEKGYGPLVYEVAMMFLNSKGQMLMSARDGDTKEAAWSVWKKFYDRSDVSKNTLDKDDPQFSYYIFFDDKFENTEERDEWYGESTDEELKELAIFNTGFSMSPNEEYKTLVGRADKEYYDNARETCTTFWQNNYN